MRPAKDSFYGDATPEQIARALLMQGRAERGSFWLRVWSRLRWWRRLAELRLARIFGPDDE